MDRTEYTISIAKANALAIALIAPIGLIESLPMIIFHSLSFSAFKELTFATATFGLLKLTAVITLGIVVHELLHGLGWMFFCKKKWRSISFGIKWEYMTPYCHCSEPLKRGQFLLGAALPLLVLGLVPVFIAFSTGDFKLWFFGFFFSIAASGDLIAIWMLRKVKRHQLVLDHPEELGFIVEE